MKYFLIAIAAILFLLICCPHDRDSKLEVINGSNKTIAVYFSNDSVVSNWIMTFDSICFAEEFNWYLYSGEFIHPGYSKNYDVINTSWESEVRNYYNNNLQVFVFDSAEIVKLHADSNYKYKIKYKKYNFTLGKLESIEWEISHDINFIFEKVHTFKNSDSSYIADMYIKYKTDRFFTDMYIANNTDTFFSILSEPSLKLDTINCFYNEQSTGYSITSHSNNSITLSCFKNNDVYEPDTIILNWNYRKKKFEKKILNGRLLYFKIIDSVEK